MLLGSSFPFNILTVKFTMPGEVFKQVEEKHISSEVELMVWAPKMDLIALSTTQGEVLLHRLSWQKVWTLAPPVETDTVGGLAWRPDSKVLAIGYKSGKIRLCNIENGDVLHRIEVAGAVTSLNWTEHKLPANTCFTSEPYGEETSANYLPKLQPLSKNYGDSGPVSKDNLDEVVEDSKKLKDQKELNFLVVGTNKDGVYLYVYGVFPLATCSFMIQDGSQERRVISAVITDDLFSVSAIVESYSDESDEVDYYALSFDTALITRRHKEIRKLALKYGLVSCLMEHLQATIQQMSEAWEDILTEMDSKLLKFAAEKRKHGNGTVSNDFLELLLFGTPSPELQNFLLLDLTDKGLKKLGFSIETSYLNIQKLVVKHLQAVSQALMFHLSELQGMAMWYDKFGVLGLDPSKVQAAINATGSFILCTNDLQQVIDTSIKNFKAFFRWLYVVILRLSKEDVPAELGRSSQQQLDFVAEFLKENFTHFDPDVILESERSLSGDSESPTPVKPEVRFQSPVHSRSRKSRFRMEKVGQYLRNDPLSQPPNLGSNPWVKAIQACPALQNSSVLYPLQEGMSLLQLQEAMSQKVVAALDGSLETIGNSLQCSIIYHLFTIDTQSTEGKPDRIQTPKFLQFTQGLQATDQRLLVTAFIGSHAPHGVLHILKQPTDISQVEEEDYIVAISSAGISYPDSSGAHYLFFDFGIYNENTLTLLLTGQSPDSFPIMVNFPWCRVDKDSYVVVSSMENVIGLPAMKTVELASYLDPETGLVAGGVSLPSTSIVRLDNMRAHSLAVSLRKTAVVLFHSRRRARIFMAEEEDDEDEDEEAEDDDDNEGGNGDKMDDKEEESMGNESSVLQSNQTGDNSVVSDEMADDDKENSKTSSYIETDSSAT